MDEIINERKVINLFIANTDLAYRQFCVWRKLQDERYNPIYKKNGIFWDAVLKGLLVNTLSFLAKSFEKKNDRFDDVLSIYYLCDLKLADCDETVGKLKKLRNKVLMHNDIKKAMDLEKFFKEVGLKYEDIEYLFGKLRNVFDDYPQNITDFKSFFQQIRKNSEKDVFEIMELLEQNKKIKN